MSVILPIWLRHRKAEYRSSQISFLKLNVKKCIASSTRTVYSNDAPTLCLKILGGQELLPLQQQQQQQQQQLLLLLLLLQPFNGLFSRTTWVSR